MTRRRRAGAASDPPVLEALVGRLRAVPFERDVLLLCAGVELEARFAEPLRLRGR